MPFVSSYCCDLNDMLRILCIIWGAGANLFNGIDSKCKLLNLQIKRGENLYGYASKFGYALLYPKFSLFHNIFYFLF